MIEKVSLCKQGYPDTYYSKETGYRYHRDSSFTDMMQADDDDDDDNGDAGDTSDDTVVLPGCMVPEQLGDGDGHPDGVGLAAPRLRDVSHAAHQVLRG